MGGDAPVQKHAVFAAIGLAAPDHQLAVLNRDRQIMVRKSSHGQRDAIAKVRCLFDVERRIAFVATLGSAFQHPFKLLKTQHMWIGGKR